MTQLIFPPLFIGAFQMPSPKKTTIKPIIEVAEHPFIPIGNNMFVVNLAVGSIIKYQSLAGTAIISIPCNVQYGEIIWNELSQNIEIAKFNNITLLKYESEETKFVSIVFTAEANTL